MTAPYDQLLVVMPSWLGDIVMATPTLRALRELAPKAQITATVRAGLEPILAGSPFIDRIETAALRGAFGPISDGRRLAQHRPDTVLLLPNSFRSGVFARCTRAQRRIGFNRDGRGMFLTHAVPYPKHAEPSTTLNDYAYLIEQAFGCTVTNRTPSLATTQEDNAAADRMLHGIEGKLVVFNPGANRIDKRWPAANFAKLADLLRERHNCTILVNGSPAERELVDAVVNQAAPGLINLTERGSTLGALKAIIQRAALLVSNDTGPRHLAAAFGTPCVALFGPTDRRWTVLENVRERHLVAEPFLTSDYIADEHPAACTIDRIAVGDTLHASEALLNENDHQ